MSAFGVEHVKRVRILYKAILRLHKGLPLELRALGDQYVKDEFKRHKNAESPFIPVFMNEWTNYAITIANQLGNKSQNAHLGHVLTPEQVEQFTPEQIGQLRELMVETNKPVDHENPLGENPMNTGVVKDS